MLKPREITLSLSTSRALLELSEAWEIILTVENSSSNAIWLVGVTTALTIPAEVLHPAELDITSRYAQLPTVWGAGFSKVCIQPGGTYNCTWRVNYDKAAMDEKTSFRTLLLWHVFFHPGKYIIQATTHFWIDEPDMGLLTVPRLLPGNMTTEQAQVFVTQIAPDYAPKVADSNLLMLAARNAQASVLRTAVPATVSGVIEVTGRSLTILGASALGGFLAFLFRELTLAAESLQQLRWNDLLLFPAYVLTAVILNLVLSRVAEAKVPLTIRIMDFWGAITFGIVLALGGNVLIKAAFGFLTSP